MPKWWCTRAAHGKGLPGARIYRIRPSGHKPACRESPRPTRRAREPIARPGGRVRPAAAHARGDVRVRKKVAAVLREAGRDVVDWALNHAEPAVEDCPARVAFGEETYRRRAKNADFGLRATGCPGYRATATGYGLRAGWRGDGEAHSPRPVVLDS